MCVSYFVTTSLVWYRNNWPCCAVYVNFVFFYSFICQRQPQNEEINEIRNRILLFISIRCIEDKKI